MLNDSIVVSRESAHVNIHNSPPNSCGSQLCKLKDARESVSKSDCKQAERNLIHEVVFQ